MLGQAPTLRISRDVMSNVFLKSGSRVGWLPRVAWAWQCWDPWCLVPQRRLDLQILRLSPFWRSLLCLKGWKLMSHLEAIQVPGAESMCCPHWSEMPQHLEGTPV